MFLLSNNFINSSSATKPLLEATLRQTLLQLESNIVLQFMHPNWSLLRKPWVQAVQLCQAPRDFARALCVLQVCILYYEKKSLSTNLKLT